MEFLSQKPMYSDDPTTKGFDLSSGDMWIYPENYPLREYQFQIVKSALYHNTLVCLPTGLGKTFVAAVVMYNFWRWYPQGKIVFLAPTKPLVAQQINACQEIMGIPSTETIELTGTTDQKKRQVAWLRHRVVFATPQVFQKDLEKKIVPSDRVKCVVVDEAHKALGKHSYCESIRLMSEQNEYFRVLALSATPGGKLDAVQEVVRNLHITHMELRDDTSPDILPYINERKLDVVLVGLGAELEGFKDRYVTIMDRHVRPLVEHNVLRGFAGNISKGRIFHLHKEWQQKSNKTGNHGQVMKTLMILMTMYHAYELMVRHGLRAFYNFYQNHMDKFWLGDEHDLLRLLEEINYYLGPFPDVRPMTDGTVPEIPEDIRFGHNKFQKLKELLLRHFESFETKEEKTRAIVFVEYRDIVNEVYVLLLQSRPLIRPQKFVGQAGLKQKQQKLALEDFRSNKVNVLISTSVGEEGLDVGEVDLIVCFDISQHSPIRLVQRMGRTGRKRDGHIIVLVTDGKEHQTLKSTISRRDSLNTKVLHSSGIINALHEESPRMVPVEFNPECQKMLMTIVPKPVPTKTNKAKKKEPKKPQNRKNSKLVEPSTSNKTGGSQSSLMKFFKKPNDDPPIEVDDDIVAVTINEIAAVSVPTSRATQSSQQSLKNNSAIKSSEVKLLSSDDAAVEFLTLCTMKKSKNDETHDVRTDENPFVPFNSIVTDENENFFDFEVPDLRIIDCLKNITDCVVPSIDNDSGDIAKSETSDRFDDCNDFYASPFNDIIEDSKFEALLDESSDDADANVVQPKQPEIDDFPIDEPVDWAKNVHGMSFEELLDETSDESRTSVKDNNESARNKDRETFRRSSNELLNEPGVFEDILDSSSNDSNDDCDPRDANVGHEARDGDHRKITTKNKFVKTIEDVEKSACEKFDLSHVTRKISTTKNLNPRTIDDESNEPIEIILNSSSENGENVCAVKTKPDLSETSTKIFRNEFEGTFEEILNCSSDDSSTDSNLDVKSDVPQLTTVETTTKNVVESTMKDEFNGAFEDILNTSSDGSETDCSIRVVFEKPNESNESSIVKKFVENPIDDDRDRAFENILDSSSDGSATDCDIPVKSVGPKESDVSSSTKKPIVNTIDDDRDRAFEAILDSTSDGSETDCSLSPKRNAINDSNVKIARKNLCNYDSANGSSDSLAKRRKIAKNSSNDYDRRNFEIFRNTAKPSTSGGKTKNFDRDNCSLLTISQTLREIDRINTTKFFDKDSEVNNVKRNASEDERSTSPVFPDRPRAASCKIFSNEIGRREKTTRSSSLVEFHRTDEIAESEEDIFETDDLTVDSDFETIISNIEKTVVANASVANDQIRRRSIVDDANEINVDKKIVFDELNRNKIVKSIIGVSEKRSRSNDREETKQPTRSVCSSIATSLVSELNLDDFEWDSEEGKKIRRVARTTKKSVDSVDSDWDGRKTINSNGPTDKESLADTVDVADCYWTPRETKHRTTTPNKETPVETVDLTDCDWNEEQPIKSVEPIVKETAVDTVDFGDLDWENDFVAGQSKSSSCNFKFVRNVDDRDFTSKPKKAKNSIGSSIDKISNDIVLDDCDWSSDFETSSSALITSPNFSKIEKNRESTRSIGKSTIKVDDEINNDKKSTVRSKINLSLGKYLTSDIRKNLLNKRTRKKTSIDDRDSDSETEFAVGRLETRLAREIDSDFFAKPNPVDKTTRMQTSSMSKFRRIVRQPLSERKIDDNKLSVNELRHFSAPDKYTQQHRKTTNTAIADAGRRKTISRDSDATKKRKKHRNERNGIRVRNEFIDDEAEDSANGDESTETSETDDDLDGFVSYTQHADDSVDMEAHYLQTVRSPNVKGLFYARRPRSPDDDILVYSQEIPDEPNSYLYDSFCVAEDDDVFGDSGTADEVSRLEEIERNLKAKKRKRKQSEDTRGNSKRRVITRPTDTSSSEDEFEKLRHQINNHP